MRINEKLEASQLKEKIQRLFELSGRKILDIEASWNPEQGTPVFTVQGKYTSRGWTEWTQGFQYGSALLQYDATGDEKFLEIGRKRTLERMAPHVTHTGVHDHGFNNISTYGNLLRLMHEGKIEKNEWERHFYEMALKVSGAVQAMRWSTTSDGLGYVYSFNGPHSLFVDTIRSMRSLSLAYKLGHVLMGEQDMEISLLERSIKHCLSTARYNVYYGKGRDAFDVPGRTIHEAIFNRNNGVFRNPSTQQGYTPFSTWTRGLAWAITGFAEELEFLDTVEDQEVNMDGGKEGVVREYLEAACVTADFYITNTPTDGIPYWDTGAPGLAFMGDYFNRPAEPDNNHEPVDSSAAAITAQGLIRLGKYLLGKGDNHAGRRYYKAGLTIANALFDEPYLSLSDGHQGLILHSVYHRPNGWDYIPPGSKVPNGESSMWGDYHARELGVLILREGGTGPYPAFFS
ncbi:MAG: glycoside hydrolase family 88 protein [bacterium]|jgi:unsaturated chondroitin disaccharide hydrolase